MLQPNLICPQTLNYPMHLTKSISPDAPNLNHLPTLPIFLTHPPQTPLSHLPFQTCLTCLHITFNFLLSAYLHLFLNSPFMIFFTTSPACLLIAFCCLSLSLPSLFPSPTLKTITPISHPLLLLSLSHTP